MPLDVAATTVSAGGYGTSPEPTRAPEPVSAWEPADDDFDGPTGLGDFGEATSHDGPDAADEAEVETAPQSPMRALMNSLGGLVWIALVVLYSLAQSCGE